MIYSLDTDSGMNDEFTVTSLKKDPPTFNQNLFKQVNLKQDILIGLPKLHRFYIVTFASLSPTSAQQTIKKTASFC